MEYMEFGNTGHTSSRIIFGAAALWDVSQHEADQTLGLLLDHGINHIDTARSYGDAELRVGPWMREHRSSFFLASKTNKRTKAEALEELEQTLRRLQTDHIDLWQLHYLVEDEEWKVAMGESGALEAAMEAKRKGLVKFVGVTGHGVNAPKAHLKSLGRHDFDSVLLPYNFLMMQNPQYAEDFETLLSYCDTHNVAFQTIKSLARGDLGDKQKVYTTWYDPLVNEESIQKSIHWVLANKKVFLNSTGDIHILPAILKAAEMGYARPSDEQMLNLVQQEGMQPLFT